MRISLDLLNRNAIETNVLQYANTNCYSQIILIEVHRLIKH